MPSVGLLNKENRLFDVCYNFCGTLFVCGKMSLGAPFCLSITLDYNSFIKYFYNLGEVILYNADFYNIAGKC